MKRAIHPAGAVDAILNHVGDLDRHERAAAELRERILSLCESLSGLVEPGDVVRVGSDRRPVELSFFLNPEGKLCARRLIVKQASELQWPSGTVAFPDEDHDDPELN